VETPEPDDVTSDASAGTLRDDVVTALPVAIAGLVANATGVIVTILLARVLTTQGYGAYAQLVGLFLVVSMPGSALIVAVVRRTALWRTSGSHEALALWATKMHRRMWWFLGVWTAIVLAISFPVAHLLAKPSPVAVAGMMLGAGVWVVLCVDRGFLQGSRGYRALSVNLLIEAGVRTVTVLAFAVVFKLPGAALGVLIGEALTAYHARRVSLSALRGVTDDHLAVTPPSIRRDLVIDLGVALVALALVAGLQNVDVILLGRLNPHASGSYAAVSTVCKGLVYVAVAIAGYLLPEAAISHHEGNHGLRQLSVAIGLLSLPAVALLAAATFFPDTIIKLVFGSRYLGAESAFLPLAGAMACFSITVILSFYLLAHGRHWIAPLLGLGLVAAGVAIETAHGAPHATAISDLLVQAALALAVFLSFAVSHLRNHGVPFAGGLASEEFGIA